ncbi:MAG: prepilin-type N-terminal cleavage/methylation domain-containing protein, partial [Elusimicrobiaceae bacterium]|nr:prepilin-type N-terminal cleavage/methylation domain-containing protein [Elusimicrobiaceae bacterium]
MNTQKGFTLIEMLVVVLIIGILTSIAMPQYIKMVNKSRLAAVWQPMRMLQKAAMVCITEGKLSEGGGAGLDELQNLSSLACMDGFPSDSLKVHPKFNGISDADWDYFINYQGTVALGEQDKIFIGITRN